VAIHDSISHFCEELAMKATSLTIWMGVSVCVMALASIASATVIRGIDIDFVTIGNPGNPGDTRPEASPYGCGAVGYEYQIGMYEITNAQWNAFVAAAGAPTGNPSYAYDESAYFTGESVPTNMVSWYEAAQFCNYLTSGDKALGAYQLGTDGSITIDRDSAVSAFGIAYGIPTEDEWYKAAYYRPDESGYSTYANGLDTITAADSWNYLYTVPIPPWDVGTGTMEQNGTFEMMGNVWEWAETMTGRFDYRVYRGGAFNYYGSDCRSSRRPSNVTSYNESNNMGFRVASVPEPTTITLLGLGALMLRRRKK
jgi:formylglycine-generating enzyme required for sulfatase activity